MYDKETHPHICRSADELPPGARVIIPHDEDADESLQKEDLPQLKLLEAAGRTP